MQERTIPINIEVLSIHDPCVSLRRASRAISHFYDQVLSPTGLKVTQFIILHAIGLRTEVAQWRLSSEYGISNDTLSRRLALLRRNGLIAYRIGNDRPGERLYHLTPDGLTTLRRALPYWERAQVRFLQAIGNSAGWDLLLNNIDQICEFAKLAENGRFTNTLPTQAKAAAAANEEAA